MPSPKKIPLDELHMLLSRGYTNKMLAKRFKVSPAAITLARQRISMGVVKSSVPKDLPVTTPQADIVSRMQKSLDEFDLDLRRSLDLLEQAATVGEKASALRLKADIQDKAGKQISRIVDATRTLADFRIMGEFMEQVLDCIERVNPDERRRIVNTLEQVCGASIRAFIRPSEEISERVPDQGTENQAGGCGNGARGGEGAGDLPEREPGGNG